MALELVEPIIAAFAARLTADLPGEIDAENAATTDGILLDVPAVLDYVPPMSELTAFPAVAMCEGDGTFADDVGFGATGVYELIFVIWDQHADQRMLTVRLRRLQKAVARVALAGRQCGPAWGVQLKGLRPGPSRRREERPQEWVSWTAMAIQCKCEEDA